MKKYVIDLKQGEYFNAGFKAKVDVDNILQKDGFEVKYLKVKDAKTMIDKIKNCRSAYRQLVKILDEIERDSILIFQYPIDLITYKFAKKIKQVCVSKNIKTVCLVHDVVALHHLNKFADLYYNKLKREIKFFDSFDYIISHNKSMTKYFTDNAIDKSKIIDLGIFDYIIDNVPSIDTEKRNKIIIAGNLSKWKSGYIYVLNNLKSENYNFELFGSEYNGEKNKFVNYNGAFKSDELPLHINYGFGLIWDGSSIDKINGSFGEYLKYNNPHKFSLYMATGIPVIVWKQSALADFVKENEVGYTIDSLNDLEKIFEQLTVDDYDRLQKNVKFIQDKVIRGGFLLDAVNKIMDSYSN